eukprot:10521672-Ditylum_brightwellii.AAC.1
MPPTSKTERYHYSQSSDTHEGQPDSNSKPEETPPLPKLMKTAVILFSSEHEQMIQIDDSSSLSSTTSANIPDLIQREDFQREYSSSSDLSQITKESKHTADNAKKKSSTPKTAEATMDPVLATILLENQKNNQQMQQMMVLFNTTLEAMKDQNCPPPPSSSHKIERALESILEIICLQAEAMRSATEETQRSQEEKGLMDNKFAHFGNRPSENFTA